MGEKGAKNFGMTWQVVTTPGIELYTLQGYYSEGIGCTVATVGC